MALSQSTDYSPEERRILLDLAWASVRQAVGSGEAVMPEVEDLPPRLQEQKACFVTLTIGHRLRGCIGSLEPHEPLAIGVINNAASAAVRDSRFDPLTPAEIPDLSLEISVLSNAVPLPVACEAELYQALRPGVDGVILSEGWRRATFLPQVWEQVESPQAFIRQLKLKAGLPTDYWSKTLKIAVYQVVSIHE